MKALAEAKNSNCHAIEMDLIKGLKAKESALRKTVKEMAEKTNALEKALANAKYDQKVAVEFGKTKAAELKDANYHAMEIMENKLAKVKQALSDANIAVKEARN